MKRAIVTLVLLATTLPIAGCIIAPYPGYYHHPYRCDYYRCW